MPANSGMKPMDVFAEMEEQALRELATRGQSTIDDMVVAAWRIALAQYASLVDAPSGKQAEFRGKLRAAITEKLEQQAAAQASVVRAMFQGARIAVEVIEHMEDERSVAAPVRFSMGLLNLVELALPPRLVAEDMGDTIERLHRLQRSGASGLTVLFAGITGALWIALNGIREGIRRLHGKSR